MEEVTYINILMVGNINQREFILQILQLGKIGYDHAYKLSIKNYIILVFKWSFK